MIMPAHAVSDEYNEDYNVLVATSLDSPLKPHFILRFSKVCR